MKKKINKLWLFLKIVEAICALTSAVSGIMYLYNELVFLAYLLTYACISIIILEIVTNIIVCIDK